MCCNLLKSLHNVHDPQLKLDLKSIWDYLINPTMKRFRHAGWHWRWIRDELTQEWLNCTTLLFCIAHVVAVGEWEGAWVPVLELHVFIWVHTHSYIYGFKTFRCRPVFFYLLQRDCFCRLENRVTDSQSCGSVKTRDVRYQPFTDIRYIDIVQTVHFRFQYKPLPIYAPVCPQNSG